MPDKNEEEISSIRCQPDAGAAVATGAGAAAGAAAATGAGAAAGGAQAAPADEPSVGAMIARLDGLDGLPLEEHVAVFEDIHAGLRHVLSELDAAPDGAAGQQPGPGGR